MSALATASVPQRNSAIRRTSIVYPSSSRVSGDPLAQRVSALTKFGNAQTEGVGDGR